MPITKEDLRNRFMHHAPAEGSNKPSKYKGIRQQMRATAEFVVGFTPECREQSVAITKLEEAMFWANAAIARNEENDGET